MKDNTIWYTTTDNQPIIINSEPLGPQVAYHQYKNGVGAIHLCGDVTTINPWMFYNCYNLYSIELPDSIKSIGDSAFMRCSALTSISIPNWQRLFLRL